MTKKVQSKKAPKSQEQKDYQALYLRALADYQNLKKRSDAEKQDFIKFANLALIDKLLAVLDDLERAQDHLKDPGLQMVTNQFLQVLNSESITVIKTEDQPFDPESMDCVEVVAGKKNQVINTLSKGYRYHDKVIRPARVQVGSGE